MKKSENLKLLSDRLKYLMDYYGTYGNKITASSLAKIANTSRTSVSFWMNDTNGISADAARAIGKHFGADPVWIETGEGEPFPVSEYIEENDIMFSRRPVSEEIDLDDTDEFIKIKRVDLKLSAGITGYSVEYLNGDRAPIIFRRDWVESKGLNPSKLYALKVSGQSMETSLYDNDLVVINADDTKPVDGEVFAVNYEGELVIKRLIRQAGAWHLSSDNMDKRKYADKVCHENCIIIGRVIYKQSERI